MITPGLDLAAFARENRVRFVRKDRSRFMRVLGWLFGLVGYDFMRRAWTTIGRTVYYPTGGPDASLRFFVRDWIEYNAWRNVPEPFPMPEDVLEYLAKHRSTVEHELHHVLQFKRLWHLHSLLYLLGVPLPVGLAWYRWRCERVAYLHVLRHYGTPPPEAVLVVEGGKIDEGVLGRIKAELTRCKRTAGEPLIQKLGSVVDPIQDMRVNETVNTLWRVYGWPWPRRWMRRWLWKELEKDDDNINGKEEESCT